MSSTETIDKVCLTSLAPLRKMLRICSPMPSRLRSTNAGRLIQISVRSTRLVIRSSRVISSELSATLSACNTQWESTPDISRVCSPISVFRVSRNILWYREVYSDQDYISSFNFSVKSSTALCYPHCKSKIDAPSLVWGCPFRAYSIAWRPV